MDSSKLCVCKGDGCENCGGSHAHADDAVLSHPAGLMAVVAVAGSVGVLYGMVAMLFVETFSA